MSLTNKTNLPISIAVWLAQDNYSHSTDPNTISVTSLLKPIRSLLIGQGMAVSKVIDVVDLIPSRVGTAIHDSIQTAWNYYQSSLPLLEIPQDTVDKIRINPINTLEGEYPVYIEKRTVKSINGYIITGQFDFVINDTVTDFKSGSVWGYINQSNKDDYIKQASIYRWLNPEIIKEDIVNIIYIFTDWSKQAAIKDRQYPQQRILEVKYPLMSLEDTEAFIKERLGQLDRYKNMSQNEYPRCTPEELWQSNTVWKYYRDPNKTNRSTKNFNSIHEANTRLINDGSKGVIKEFKGKVKRCIYCNAAPECSQRIDLEIQGLLDI